MAYERKCKTAAELSFARSACGKLGAIKSAEVRRERAKAKEKVKMVAIMVPEKLREDLRCLAERFKTPVVDLLAECVDTMLGNGGAIDAAIAQREAAKNATAQVAEDPFTR